MAKAEPVVVGGVTTQASDLAISDDYAYIAYNAAGDDFFGAIQILDISDKRRPRLLAELHFEYMDIYAVLADGDTLVFGGAAHPDFWGFRSFIGKLNVSDPTNADVQSSLEPLSSYAVTDLAAHGDYYYASVGALDGGIHIVDSSLQSLEFIPRGDVRGLDNYRHGVVALAGTTDTPETDAAILFMTGLSLVGSVTIDDFGSDYAKATITSNGSDIAILGLSAAGMHVFDVSDVSAGDHLDPLVIHENPDVANPDVVATTNSVSYHGNLLFSANGGWGVRVFFFPDLAELSAIATTTLQGYFPWNLLSRPASGRRLFADREYRMDPKIQSGPN